MKHCSMDLVADDPRMDREEIIPEFIVVFLSHVLDIYMIYTMISLFGQQFSCFCKNFDI